MPSDARSELVDFLERHAFNPVMRAKAEGRSDAEKCRLEDVQTATEAEIKRFRAYGSAREVVENFRSDLNSEPAKKVHADLRSLDLPTINDVRDEFERRADALGVGAA